MEVRQNIPVGQSVRPQQQRLAGNDLQLPLALLDVVEGVVPDVPQVSLGRSFRQESAGLEHLPVGIKGELHSLNLDRRATCGGQVGVLR